MCPVEHKQVFDEIVRKAETGEALTPHLSRLFLETNFHDPLLNDWGIHHLHLGKNVERDGFVERTGPLLFVFVTQDVFHVLCIRPHKGAWTDEALLEVLLFNWPHLLAPFEVRGIGAGEPTSAADRAKLRKAGVQVLTTLSNGKCYAPPGGGVNTAGSNVRLVMQHDRIIKRLRIIESDIRDNLEQKRRQLPAGRSFGTPPTFHLEIQPDAFMVVEPTADVKFQYSP